MDIAFYGSYVALFRYIVVVVDDDGVFDVIPNTITYNTYLDALAKSGDDDVPDKAITILSKMKKHLIHDNDDGDDGYK
eukprot:3293785-Ditylum_brightwellii.AAC.1